MSLLRLTQHIEKEDNYRIEMAFEDFAFKIGHTPERVGLYSGFCILHHYFTVTVVNIGKGKGLLRQTIKKQLLGLEVFVKCFMKIQMVEREV